MSPDLSGRFGGNPFQRPERDTKRKCRRPQEASRGSGCQQQARWPLRSSRCRQSLPAMKPRCLSVQQQAAARSPIRAEWKAQRSKPLTHGLALPYCRFAGYRSPWSQKHPACNPLSFTLHPARPAGLRAPPLLLPRPPVSLAPPPAATVGGGCKP